MICILVVVRPPQPNRPIMVFDVINFEIVQIENVSKHAEGGSSYGGAFCVCVTKLL